MNELKAKCEAIEKREAERRAIEEKKHAEEIQFLKRTNQQLKVRAVVISCILHSLSMSGVRYRGKATNSMELSYNEEVGKDFVLGSKSG